MTLTLGRVKPLCTCAHPYHSHTVYQGCGCAEDDCECLSYVAAPDWPILPRKVPSAAVMLDDIRSIITNRRENVAAYGEPLTDAWVDELARTITQRYILGDS